MEQNLRVRQRLCSLAGVEPDSTGHREKLASGVGGLLGILLVYLVTQQWMAGPGSPFIIASMGASAVLVFAAPHAALSQPWPVLGGNLISAAIGVTCALSIADTALAASAAVGLAIGVMYYLRCLHPPGGATALLAVIGGESVRTLGYDFVLFPVLANTLCLLLAGLVFNALIPWRRYPHGRLAHREPEPGANLEGRVRVDHIETALAHTDSFVDAAPEDLLELFERARFEAERGKK